MMHVPGKRLGRLPHDQSVVDALPRYQASRPPPPRLDRSHIPFVPGMYSNDTLPDCTAAGLANAARAASWVHANTDIVIEAADVPRFYADTIGLPDASMSELEASDGALLTTVLAYQQQWGFDVGEQVDLICNYHAIDPLNRADIASAMVQGCGYLGVALAVADQTTEIWDIDTPASAGNPTPGSWGGHCLIGWQYAGLADTDLVLLATWGGFQPATWRWVASRLSESYALSWPQLAKAI